MNRRRLPGRAAITCLVVLGVVASFPARGSAGEPPDCGVGAVTPWNRQDGYVVAKGNIFCLDGGSSLIRIVVRLQYRSSPAARLADGRCRERPHRCAGGALVTKVPYPCRRGGWRTTVNTWYRFQLSDPWSRLTDPLRSSREVKDCH